MYFRLSIVISFLLLTFSIYSQKVHLNEDFDAATLPAGWNSNIITGNAGWSFGIDASSFRVGVNNLDGSNLVFFDDDLLGNGAPASTVHLVSPSFDNSTDSSSVLEFDYNFDKYVSAFSKFEVEIFDGSAWNSILLRTSADCGDWTSQNCLQGFPSARIDISAYKNQNCQVRFIYDDGGSWDFGIALDNVYISAPYAFDLLIDSLFMKKDGCNFSSNDSLKVRVVNIGSTPISSFRVGYILNTGPVVWDTIQSLILSDSSQIVQLRTPVNLSTAGTYNLKIFTDFQGELDRSNDTLIEIINKRPIFQLPYQDDFEDTSIFRRIGGINPSWENAIPNGQTISSSFSGNYSLITNSIGNYNKLEDSYVTTPCLDLSKDSIDPIFEIRANFDIESTWDKVFWEYSIDDGTSWNILQKGSLSSNWTDQVNSYFWGNSDGWIRIRNRLDGLGVEDDILFRIKIQTDGSTELEGIAIDNLNIYVPKFDLSIDSIASFDTYECGFNSTVPIEAFLSNWSEDTLTQFSISYQLNGNTPIVETVNDTIFPNGSISYIFNQRADLSAIGTYSLNIWVDQMNDNYSKNDSLLNIEINQNRIYASLNETPFFEDFENFNSPSLGDWVTETSTSFQWQSNQGGTPSIGTGPLGDKTSSLGTYIYSEASTSPVTDSTSIISPCIAVNAIDAPYLSYWVHALGSHIQHFSLDLYDGTQWINEIDSFRSQLQVSQGQPYQRRLVQLPSSTKDAIKLRFKIRKTGFESDIAIDDISIFSSDLLVGVIANQGCSSTGTKQAVTAVIENTIADSILADSTFLSYRVNGGVWRNDTLSSTIYFGDSLLFTFSDSLDYSLYSSEIKLDVLVEYDKNGLQIRDSIFDHEVQNPSLSNYLREDFESLSIGSGLSISAWDFSPEWQLVNENLNASDKIPSQDPGTDEQFIFSEYKLSSINNNARRVVLAYLPCIRIQANDSASLKFKYKIVGDQFNSLYIGEVVNNIIVSIIDSVGGGSNVDSWDSKIVDLSAFAGQSIRLGFAFNARTSALYNSIALDDIEIIDQSSTLDLKLVSADLEVNDCDYNSAQLRLQIENNGGINIPARSAVAAYQINNQGFLIDTISSAIPPGSSYTHNFPPNVNFAFSGPQMQIDTWVSHPNDTLNNNDSIINLSIFNTSGVNSLFEDFESYIDLNCNSSSGDLVMNGWLNDSLGWSIQNGFACQGTPNPNSGPAVDHTTGRGNFIFVNQLDANSEAILETPCLEFNQWATIPSLEYWYHMYGSDIGTLFIEKNIGSGWVTIDSVVGQQQASSVSAWQRDTLFLNDLNLKVRFRAVGNGPNSQIALDDINFFNANVTDLSARSIVTETTVAIYPNPNNGRFWLEISDDLLGQEIIVYDLKGKAILRFLANSLKDQIELHAFNKGMYLLRIPEKSINKKIIIH